jgi:hypothetical protein
MKRFKDAAFVVSLHEDVSPGTLRINLKWQGNHEIFDFNLDRLGKVEINKLSSPAKSKNRYQLHNTSQSLREQLPDTIKSRFYRL